MLNFNFVFLYVIKNNFFLIINYIYKGLSLNYKIFNIISIIIEKQFLEFYLKFIHYNLNYIVFISVVVLIL